MHIVPTYSQTTSVSNELESVQTKRRGGGRGDGTGGGRGNGRLSVTSVNSELLHYTSILNREADSLQVLTLLNAANDYYNVDIDTSTLLTEKALEISIAGNYKRGEILSRYELIVFYMKNSLWEKCVSNNLTLLSVLANDSIYNRSFVFESIARCYQAMGDTEQANEAWQNALTNAEVSQDSLGLMNALIDWALYQDQLKQYDLAKDLFDRSLSVAYALDNPVAIATVTGYIGDVLIHSGKFGDGIVYLKKSLRLKQADFRPVSMAYGYYHLQQAYFNNGQYDESVVYGKKLIALLYKNNPGTELFIESLTLMNNTYQAQGLQIPSYLEDLKKGQQGFFGSNERQMLDRQVRSIYQSEKTKDLIEDQKVEIFALILENAKKEQIILVTAAGLFLLFGAIYLLRSRAFARKEKQIQEAFSQQLLGHQEQERLRISRDLHDSIGQSLVLIKNKVQLNNDDETSSMIADTLAEVRSISKQLHPVLLKRLGLTIALEKLFEEVDNNTEIFVESEVDNIDNLFSEENELHIYRIVQESINNMLKHANTPSAHFTVENKSDFVKCTIADRGKGFDLIEDPSRLQGFGMQTLRERTKILKGKLIIDAVKGKGTTLSIIINKQGQA